MSIDFKIIKSKKRHRDHEKVPAAIFENEGLIFRKSHHDIDFENEVRSQNVISIMEKILFQKLKTLIYS